MLWTLLGGMLIVLIWYYLIKPLNYWTRKGVKQTKPWILFGDSWRTTFRRISLPEFVEYLYNMYPGSRYSGFYQFNTPTLLIRDPELAKQITIRDFDHFTDHKFFIDTKADPLWGGNLFALEGKKWREMRATVSRIFTSSKIKNMFVLMESAAENFVKYFLNKNQDILEVDLKDTFTRYTNDVIATTAFGIQVDSLNEPTNAFYLMGKELTNFSGILTNIKIMGNLVIPKIMRLLKIGVFSKEVTSFFTNIIFETIRTREEQGIVRPDLINMLIEIRKGVKQEEGETVPSLKDQEDIATFKQYRHVTNDEIASQAFVFFFGGFDTISTVMCFGCHELAFNKDVQDRLREEIRKTYHENGGKLTYDILLQMKYLDMVVSETLRKWPPGIFLDRVCTKPYTIEPVDENESPVHLNVGDVLWIAAQGIHRDPTYYNNPKRFDPERFSDENQGNINPYIYMPFGTGPRNCIGSRFALIEVKALLFNLLLNFEFVPTGKTKENIQLSKKSLIPTAEGFWLGLKRLNTCDVSC